MAAVRGWRPLSLPAAEEPHNLPCISTPRSLYLLSTPKTLRALRCYKPFISEKVFYLFCPSFRHSPLERAEAMGLQGSSCHALPHTAPHLATSLWKIRVIMGIKHKKQATFRWWLVRGEQHPPSPKPRFLVGLEEKGWVGWSRHPAKSSKSAFFPLSSSDRDVVGFFSKDLVTKNNTKLDKGCSPRLTRCPETLRPPRLISEEDYFSPLKEETVSSTFPKLNEVFRKIRQRKEMTA